MAHTRRGIRSHQGLARRPSNEDELPQKQERQQASWYKRRKAWLQQQDEYVATVYNN